MDNATFNILRAAQQAGFVVTENRRTPGRYLLGDPFGNIIRYNGAYDMTPAEIRIICDSLAGHERMVSEIEEILRGDPDATD